ncbi:MAG: IS110 family transposase [Eubacterium sp.]
MNSTQNKKIEQVKETTMIVGIDVGSEKHYFRAFNWRGIELTRKPVPFSNSMEGFNSFYNTVVELMQKNKLEEAMVGIEPTGHYWFDLGQFMGEKDIKFVMVNPHHVHKTKELDDNSPSKNDRKDPRVIAGLVKDGRYFYSYMPTGVYAELRNVHRSLVEELTRAKNRLQKWIAVYFPEYKGIYTHIDAKGGLLVLKQASTPEEIVKLGVDGIIKIWKDAKLRGNGHKKAILILNAAMNSIGLKSGLTEAKMEIQDLIEDYELQTKRLERVNGLIKELCQQIEHVDKLLEIKGIGITTVAGFIAEVGDITRFDNTKELQKLAGLELVADSSGKHNGKTKISKRGRKRLRYLLFEAAISVVGKNEEFREIHRYYTTREKNPLKKDAVTYSGSL